MGLSHCEYRKTSSICNTIIFMFIHKSNILLIQNSCKSVQGNIFLSASSNAMNLYCCKILQTRYSTKMSQKICDMGVFYSTCYQRTAHYYWDAPLFPIPKPALEVIMKRPTLGSSRHDLIGHGNQVKVINLDVNRKGFQKGKKTYQI